MAQHTEKDKPEENSLDYFNMRYDQKKRDFEHILNFARNILDDHDRLAEHVQKLATYIDAVRKGED